MPFKSLPVTLGFHEHVFKLPFGLSQDFSGPACEGIVIHSVSEIVKTKVANFGVVTFIKIEMLYWLAEMIKLSQVTCSVKFDSVAHEIAIKFH